MTDRGPTVHYTVFRYQSIILISITKQFLRRGSLNFTIFIVALFLCFHQEVSFLFVLFRLIGHLVISSNYSNKAKQIFE